jgi:glycosyltransferase involved in cell wall biosynthesis
LRAVQPFVDCYVANSHAVRRLVQQREGAADKKISVIYNGYDAPLETDGETDIASERLGLPRSAPVVGIVANLKPVKRIDTLVEAFSLIGDRHPDSRLVIVGDVDSREGRATLRALESLAQELGVRERIVFAGRVDAPMPYIKRFTVAVLCSESEGFSNSIIEYMQARRAVVCTDAGGNAELVRDGDNGFLVPVGDARALADRLDRLMSEPDLARQMGGAALETVSAYSHTRMVGEQMACYDEVLASRRSRRRIGRTMAG